MTYKQIQTAHEVRMWIKEVIVPVVGVTAMVLSIPEVRTAVSEKVLKVKDTIAKKFKKDGSQK